MTFDQEWHMKFNKLADITDWQQPPFQQAVEELQFTTKRKSRKNWEFIQVYQGLKTLGMLNGESRALGLGVGHEPLIYAFCNTCKSVVATDLYSSSVWASAEMETEKVYHLNPVEYERDRLTVRHMDMTAIDYPDESFDFVWSCCSIEHLNNFQDLHRLYQEVHRVLRPGGIAALTTEFKVTGDSGYEPNMLYTDQLWVEHWLTGSERLVQGLELVEPIEWAIADVEGNQPRSRRTEARIQGYSNDLVLTSFSFFLRKEGEFTQPYHEDWLDPLWSRYLAGCDAQREGRYSEAEAAFQALITDASSIRMRVRATRRLCDALKAQEKTREIRMLCEEILPFALQTTAADHLLPLANYCRSVQLQQAALQLYRAVQDSPGAITRQVFRAYVGRIASFIDAEDYPTAQIELDQVDRFLQTLGVEAPVQYQQVEAVLPLLAQQRFRLYQQSKGVDALIQYYRQAIQQASSLELVKEHSRNLDQIWQQQVNELESKLQAFKASREFQVGRKLKKFLGKK
jgi:SAM-dependent methyltransferase